MPDHLTGPNIYADNDALHVEGFSLSDSVLLNDKTLTALKNYRAYQLLSIQQAMHQQTERREASAADEITLLEHERFYRGPVYAELQKRYAVSVVVKKISGVPVEVFTPEKGVVSEHKQHILINLHGGGFCSGSRTNSHLESIPVAALGRIKVVSVDYRMAPAHRYPVATDDVEAVYRALLADYGAENIGLYGASSGALLTAQTMVRLLEKNLPLPVAISMIAGGATWVEGDSLAWGAAILQASLGYDLQGFRRTYFESADLSDPQVIPALSDHFMENFPPSLLAASTRDYLLSSVVSTHRQFFRLGVSAELHVWEGLDHVFHYNPALPETDELHRTVVNFFNRQWGEKPVKRKTGGKA
jgi:acetyl esterase/lipase